MRPVLKRLIPTIKRRAARVETRHGEQQRSNEITRTGGEEVRLMLWDTAGQEEFDAITKAYYRGAQACVVAFSTTDRDSFSAVRKWKKKVRKIDG
ncbi:Ras-related protein Rab-23 [Portunus trituberculatus]|uniref:Ras-related protein Rab-23 n=1 Tax=Portunus trituberculatus TaxID=210409 RepID=A0A5B7JQC3_PORTR|nr:Ras-related protein Rab-23 [Portunus trituberculatus]